MQGWYRSLNVNMAVKQKKITIKEEIVKI